MEELTTYKETCEMAKGDTTSSFLLLHFNKNAENTLASFQFATENESILEKAVSLSCDRRFNLVKSFQLVKENLLGADPTIAYNMPSQSAFFDILVVEDDEMSRQIIALLLRRNYLSFRFAHSPEEAVEKYSDNDFRLLVVGFDNPELAQKGLKNLLQKATMPSIALVTRVQKSDVAKYKHDGFADVLSKPFSEDDLLKLIHANMKNLHQPNQSTESPTKDGASISLDQLRRIGNNDTGFLINMLEKFIISVEECSESLEAALPNKNWIQMRQAAHKSIPSYSLMGADSILSDLEFVEHQFDNESKHPEVIEHAQNIVTRNKTIIADAREEIRKLKSGKV